MPDISASDPYDVGQLKHRMAQDYKRVYANNATLGMTFWDVNMTFGETVFDAFGETPHVEDRVTIAMSWEHLKALHDMFGKLLESYESTQGGKIRNPTGGHIVPPATARPILPGAPSNQVNG